MKKKGLLYRIWNDPVWSKVIAGVFLAVLGFLISVLKGCLNESESIPDALKSVFSIKINIWVVGVIVLILLIIISLIRRHDRRIPIPPFINEFISGVYQNQVWKWHWKWSPTYKYYYIEDLNFECPYCHEGIMTYDLLEYRCVKCNREMPNIIANISYDAVKAQIIEDAKDKYSSSIKYIGRNP